MTFERPNFYILTGGPGAGKTTTLAVLRARGFHCVDEAARQILKEQAAIGGDATHDGDQRRYRDLTLDRSILLFEAVDERAAPVFFDRGIAENRDYAVPPGEAPPAHMMQAIRRYRYAPVVFIFPPWREIYRHDEERKHSFAHAEQVFADIAVAYRECGYQLCEVPCLPVEARVDFILRRIGILPRAPPGKA